MNKLEPINIYCYEHNKTFHVRPIDINIKKSIKKTTENLETWGDEWEKDQWGSPYEIHLTYASRRARYFKSFPAYECLYVSKKTYERIVNLLS